MNFLFAGGYPSLIPMTYHKAYAAALEWHLDHGADGALVDAPVDRTHIKPVPAATKVPAMGMPEKPVPAAGAEMFLGKSDAQAEAVRLAQVANTLEELREAIAEFDGISLKKTATNLVFCDGNPESAVMLVGEAPGADEDRLGKPFVGASGQLLDKILKFIDLDRAEEDAAKSLYISNILNWRPPGNRTPSPAEVAVSLPFIEKHIQLVRPQILILCGAVSAKALLGRSEGISRLRRTWHDYKPQTPELAAGAAEIKAIATYHPAYLLRTPGQKRAVWADMLEIDKKRTELNLK